MFFRLDYIEEVIFIAVPHSDCRCRILLMLLAQTLQRFGKTSSKAAPQLNSKIFRSTNSERVFNQLKTIRRACSLSSQIPILIIYPFLINNNCVRILGESNLYKLRQSLELVKGLFCSGINFSLYLLYRCQIADPVLAYGV